MRLLARRRGYLCAAADASAWGVWKANWTNLAFAVLTGRVSLAQRRCGGVYQERGTYIERVCTILRNEMRSIGLNVRCRGAQALYSIYKKCAQEATIFQSLRSSRFPYRCRHGGGLLSGTGSRTCAMAPERRPKSRTSSPTEAEWIPLAAHDGLFLDNLLRRFNS